MTLSSRINDLEKRIRQKTTILDKIKKEILAIKARWERGFLAAEAREKKINKRILEGKRTDTVGVKTLAKRNLAWKEKGEKLTEQRDAKYEEQSKAEEDLSSLKSELSKLTERIAQEREAARAFVDQIFLLTENLVRAMMTRNEYLVVNAFQKLRLPNGKILKSVTIKHPSGKRKVVIQTKNIDEIDSTMAGMAISEAEKFFERVNPTVRTDMDEATSLLYDICKRMFFEKSTFRVGDTLFEFLSMPFDHDKFPELAMARTYAIRSLRSKRSRPYVIIFEFDEVLGKFVRFKQGI